MSVLEKALSKSKLESSEKKKSKKSDMVTVAATKNIESKVDLFLKNDEKMKDLKTSQELISQELRTFAYDYVIANHETENLVIEGKDGAVNINFKDQYNDINSDAKAPLEQFLTDKGLNPEEYIKEESKVVFNFNELTKSEQDKLMKFLSKEIGADRFSKVVETKVAYKISNLKDVMIEKCSTVEEFQTFRSLSSQHAATIAKRVTK